MSKKLKLSTIKEEDAPPDRPSTSAEIKILNDKKSTPAPAMSPTKQITLVAKQKPKKSSPSGIAALKQKKMDHYLMHTVKGEKNAEGMEEVETIDFVLTEDNDDGSTTKPSGEILEELHLSDEEAISDDDAMSRTQEIVEHVCGKCFKTFRRLKVRCS